MPNVEIVAVGTELLLGQLLDRNTPFIAQALAAAGIDVRATHGVGDNVERIAKLLAECLSRCDGVLMTGGLGPTVDDVTTEAVCRALDVGVELCEPALRQMERIFAGSGRPMPPNNRKQVELPCGSRPLRNPNGTAPGFIASRGDGKFVACMPGVPREMQPMLRAGVVPFLRARFGGDEAIYTRIVHTIGVSESEVDRRIEALFRSAENPKIAVLTHDFRVDVKITAKAAGERRADEMIAPLASEIEAALTEYIFGYEDDTPASAVLTWLAARGQTLAVAESCTGGRIAAALTGVAGASRSFLGGIVAYSDGVKVDGLGVDPASLARYGAVSSQTAEAMARGARGRFGSDIALATTGVAGPTGGTPEKPIGLVWIALDDGTSGARAAEFHFTGDRDAIAQRAVTATLGILWRHLKAAAFGT